MMRGAMKIGRRPKRFGGSPRTGWLAVLSFCVGAALIAVGLELFLKPNRLVPGGAQGISILLSHMTEMRLGLFLFLVNVPFLFAGLSGSGKRSAAIRFAALIAIAAATLMLHPIPPLTEHSLFASLLGGVSLGCGAGLILRIGGYTDGVNEAAYWVKRTVPLSIAELVMLANLLLLGLAGLLFGWEQALYSVIAYYTAYQSLRFTMRGNHRYTLVRIQGDRLDDIRSDLLTRIESQMTIVPQSETTQNGAGLIVIIAREQEQKLREMMQEMDPALTISTLPLDSPQRREYKYWH